MPMVSVLIPAYNVAAFIGAAVESALTQTLSDIEVIVVNDGSEDDTRQILEPYQDRLIYHEQANRGLAGARNAALTRATGRYIALLDGDDYWAPNRLELMVSALEADPQAGWATCDSYLVRDGHPTNQTWYSRAPGWGFRTDDQDYWITQHNFVNIHTLIRSELFERHGRFDESLRSAEDWDLWIRFLFGGERVALVPEPLAYYRLRPGSLSIDPRRILDAELAVLQKAQLSRPSHPGLAGRVAYTEGKRALASGDLSQARRSFAQARRDDALHPSFRRRALLSSLSPSLARRLYASQSEGRSLS